MDLLDERKGHSKKNVANYVPKCVEGIRPSDGYELVVVPTNSYQTEEALNTLVPVSGDAIFLVFAANWEGVDFIDQRLPRERYLMGTLTVAEPSRMAFIGQTWGAKFIWAKWMANQQRNWKR